MWGFDRGDFPCAVAERSSGGVWVIAPPCLGHYGPEACKTWPSSGVRGQHKGNQQVSLLVAAFFPGCLLQSQRFPAASSSCWFLCPLIELFFSCLSISSQAYSSPPVHPSTAPPHLHSSHFPSLPAPSTTPSFTTVLPAYSLPPAPSAADPSRLPVRLQGKTTEKQPCCSHNSARSVVAGNSHRVEHPAQAQAGARPAWTDAARN